MDDKFESLDHVSMVTSDAEKSVPNVTIGSLTKAYLLCKAKITDAFNSLATIELEEFQKDLPQDFVDKWFELDDILNRMIGESVCYTFTNRDYKEI